jgi:hypothetical protein
MTGTKASVFFYGSFINLKVLAEVDLVPENVEVAQLSGFDIRIAPLATLVRSDRHSVYGILCTAGHDALERLYRRDWVAAYRPEAVDVETTNGRMAPALCYIAPPFTPLPATDEYIDRIVGPARELGFPDWYIERLESFRGGSARR